MGAGVKNMNLSFSTLACPRWSFEEMLAIAKDLHMNGIEIRGMGDTMYAPDMEIFSSANLPKTLKRLKETGLSIPILTSGAYFASAQQPGDPVGEACAYIDLAERLGVPYVRVMAEPTPQPEDGDLDLAAKKYAQVCAYAKGSGVTPELDSEFHKTVKKVTLDIDEMKFNTAIASMMTLMNKIYDFGSLTVDELSVFTKILSPFAPHMAEEMWERLGNEGFASVAAWPEYDDSKTQASDVEIVVQICGKIKCKMNIAAGTDKDELLAKAKALDEIKALLEGKTIVKEIVVPDKLVNIVAR